MTHVFVSVTVISHCLLPDGFLRNKHPLQNWETSPNLLTSTAQIFFYNLISVAVILFSNLFSSRARKTDSFMSLGYLAFFAQIAINAVVLGTWSFSVARDAVPLLHRITGMFDLLHRAGMWEMIGQLLILCATAKTPLVIMDRNETTTRSWRSIRLTQQEVLALAVGLLSILTGASVESYGIIQST
ncbi:MAG: hypothetical protein ACM3ZA_10660 [Bacillota bacterium]